MYALELCVNAIERNRGCVCVTSGEHSYGICESSVGLNIRCSGFQSVIRAKISDNVCPTCTRRK